MPTPSHKSVAILGGGVAGIAAAYELRKHGVPFTLVEASNRLGGIVETYREAGFTIECGPDGWVTDKPWARELAEELGLADQIIASRDHERITWVLQQGQLLPMPDNMRMMVPEDLDTVLHSPLFSPAAREAYASELHRAEELKASAPDRDESIASFINRHFGEEVLRVIGAPLLGGVFGGDVRQLSVRAVMAPFVQMEREHGSLIAAMSERRKQRGDRPRPSVFTSLRTGTATLVERMIATLPPECIQFQRPIERLHRADGRWTLSAQDGHAETFDHLMLAVPVLQATELLQAIDPRAAQLVHQPTSSAVIAGFGFTAENAPSIPKGFGFLSPEGEGCRLLAATFSDQKYDDRVPAGGKSLRAFFGGREAERLMSASDATILSAARSELEKVLGPLPAAKVAVVRRWPNSLPQYGVGHLERMAELASRVQQIGNLHLLGNGYRGVGLPDLIRDSRQAAREIAAG